MRQRLKWAIGYNAIALPVAAGVFEPEFGLVLRPAQTSAPSGTAHSVAGGDPKMDLPRR